MLLIERMTARGGRGGHLIHEPARPRPQGLVSDDAVGREAAGRDGEPVEGDVPAELLPQDGFERILRAAIDPGPCEQRDGGEHGVIGRALGRRHPHVPGQRVLDDARGQAVDADEAKAGHEPVARDQVGERLHVAHAVLERDQDGSRSDQRTHLVGQGRVRRRLGRDDDDVTGTEAVGRRARGGHAHLPLALAIAQGQPGLRDGRRIGAGEGPVSRPSCLARAQTCLCGSFQSLTSRTVS